MYQGRPLHAWIETIDHITFRITATNGITLQDTNAAAAAVLATADDAIPWLQSELRCHEPSLRPRLRKIALAVPQKLGGGWVVGALTPSGSQTTAWMRHRRATMAALIIGYKSRTLAPDLAQLLKSGDCCWLYTYALARMGEDGVPPLAWALTNRDEQLRRHAVQALATTTAKLDAALPALEVASRDPNWVVRGVARTTLEALNTTNPLYMNRQGWLRTDIYGNGSYEF